MNLKVNAPTADLLHPDIPGAEHAESAPLGVLNNLRLALAVIGRNNRILYKNSAFEEVFGSKLPVELRDRMDSSPSANGQSVPFQTILKDGRTIRIEAYPLPEGFLLSADDVSNRMAELAQSARLVRTDPLTLLGNRLMFTERLRSCMAHLDPATEAAAVLSIDLDRFKAVNDSLGHPVGDALLRMVADRLKSVLRPGDIAARLGGDEFRVLQTGQPQPQAAAALSQRLVDLLGRSYLIEGHLLNIGASIGIALIPGDGGGATQVMRNADLALHRAQEDGRRTYRFYESAMDERMQARRSLEIDLRRALAMRELRLVYQPQCRVGSRLITGFEALSRWHCPKRGLVPPSDFIPLAEEIGVIVEIGEWVIRTACREAAGWPEPWGISVNVSALQFGSPNLVSTIVSALEQTRLDPHRLELEITETALVKDQARALDVLNQVRAAGVRVAMDDFGTGYSSLSYLGSFPFDKIKIDKSFVSGKSGYADHAAIIRAIAALGKSLGMTTTAEGVETESQMASVMAEGCTDVQGFLISQPLPPESIREFLVSHGARYAVPSNQRIN